MRWRNTFGLLRSMNHEVIGVDVDGQDALQLREDAAYCDDDTTVLFHQSQERKILGQLGSWLYRMIDQSVIYSLQ